MAALQRTGVWCKSSKVRVTRSKIVKSADKNEYSCASQKPLSNALLDRCWIVCIDSCLFVCLSMFSVSQNSKYIRGMVKKVKVIGHKYWSPGEKM